MVSQWFIWFIVYGVLGWVWESAYCTVIERRWQNRGFLYGPTCPLYGTGVVAMMLLWGGVLREGQGMSWWQVFLIAFFGSMALEYVTHWALERLFHAYWWDYSNMPLNINGRVCLPASTLFGISGLFVAYVLYEPTMGLSASMGTNLSELLSLLFMSLLAADLAITVSALKSIARTASAINRSINEHMDRFVLDVERRGVAIAGQIQERREQTERDLAAATETVRENQAAVAKMLEEQQARAAAASAAERERFAALLRDTRVHEMPTAVLAAGRRVVGTVKPERLPNMPSADQLIQFWKDLLKQ